ncbi:MAG: GNAT family N-acetyltransferase [Elusimicrobia bacterium]|nr:GNAT family N-acetyltransferase [Elusimicrobiota bacterium]
MSYVSVLKWDSGFFGRVTARIRKGVVVTPANSRRIGDEIRRKRVAFLYYFQSVGHLDNLGLVLKMGLRPVDVTAVLRKELAADAPGAGPLEVRDILRGGPSVRLGALKDLARELSRESRFHADRELERSAAVRLYESWLDRAVSGTYADFFFVIGPSEAPKGFVVYRTTGAREVELSLLVVMKHARGRGLGRKMIEQSLGELRRRGFRRCLVRTQLRNTAALNAYEFCGFKFQEASFVFHGHYASRAASGPRALRSSRQT